MNSAAVIASLHLYPVKGCAAVDVQELHFDTDGLIVGDRAAMIVDADTGAFVSQRHVHELAVLRVTIVGRAIELAWPRRESIRCQRPNAAAIRRVTVWDDTFDADDGGEAAAEWLSDAIRQSVRLVWLRRPSGRTLDPFWATQDDRQTSFADLAPLLITNAASLDLLNARRAEAGLAPIAMSRFRPNVVVRGLPAFAEDTIAALRSDDGPVALRLIKPCARCSVTELDPATGEPTGDEVLRSLAGFRTLQNRRGTRGIMFGQNAMIDAAGSGRLAVGQTLAASFRPPEIA